MKSPGKPVIDPASVGLNPHIEEITHHCQFMLKYALREGKEIEHDMIDLLDGHGFKGTTSQLLSLYNYLVVVIKPANPRTIAVIEENRKANSVMSILGPLPIVRQFMVVAVLSMLVMILSSLTSDINVNTIQLSMLQGYGIDQFYRLVFLMSCASVGASFYALFKMNSYLSNRDFNVTLSHTYWARYVLGIVAGLLLSELFVGFVEPSAVSADDSTPLSSVGYLLKPVLAILGGFSADLVYRILNRLVKAVESLFKGDVEETIAQKKAQFETESENQINTYRTNTVQQMLSLKQTMIESGVDEQVIGHLDESLKGVMSGKPVPIPK